MGILFCTRGEDILSLGFVCLGQRNHQGTSNWLQEVIRHTQKDVEDLNIDHGHHLITIEEVKKENLKSETPYFTYIMNL